MARYEIPLTPEPQTFQIELAGVTYTITLRWNYIANCWVIDLANATNTAGIINGIPLVTGADLLGQYAYLNLGGGITVETDHDTTAVPTFTNLGTTGHVYFVTP